MSRIVTASEWRKAGLSEAVRKAEEAATERLRTDPQVQDIVRCLREKEVSADKINIFLGNLPRIIGDCDRLKGKTFKKITENSERLAKKIREFLKEMDIYRAGCGNDLDVFLSASCFLRIDYTSLVSKEDTETPEVLGLEHYLRLVAGLLDFQGSSSGQSLVNEALERSGAKDRPYKDALTVCAVKTVSCLLIGLLPDIQYYERTKKRRSPNKETAIIVNTLLDLEQPLKGNNVCNILKNKRTKYNQW